MVPGALGLSVCSTKPIGCSAEVKLPSLSSAWVGVLPETSECYSLVHESFVTCKVNVPPGQ